MAQLFPLFPIFLDMAGRSAVLLSGGPELVPLAARLLDAGAGLRVIATDVCAPMRALGAGVRVEHRRWRAADLRGAAVVIAGPFEPRAAQARASARAARALFHMVGAPERSDGVMGEAVLTGAMTIALADAETGERPLPEALSMAIKARLEQAAPLRASGFFAAALRAAPKVAAAFPQPRDEAGFWGATLDKAVRAERKDWDGWIDEAIGAFPRKGGAP